MSVKVAYVLIPSKNRSGYFNVNIPGQDGQLSCDPGGNLSFALDNPDKNYQQFLQLGLGLQIRPTDDVNPTGAPTIIIVPE